MFPIEDGAEVTGLLVDQHFAKPEIAVPIDA